jgi:hypothetical protein
VVSLGLSELRHNECVAEPLVVNDRRGIDVTQLRVDGAGNDGLEHGSRYVLGKLKGLHVLADEPSVVGPYSEVMIRSS